MEAVIECFHTPAWYGTIETKGFLQNPKINRRVCHRFEGWDLRELQSDCVVIAADLTTAAGIPRNKLREIRERCRRLLICVDGLDQASRVKGWNQLRREAKLVELTRHWDGTPSVILEL
jgi:hypothetical protein